MFTDIIKKHFIDIMNKETCYKAQLYFINNKEKKCFIINSWNDYGDVIEKFIIEEIGKKNFLLQSEIIQMNFIRNAINNNFNMIFDNSFNE